MIIEVVPPFHDCDLCGTVRGKCPLGKSPNNCYRTLVVVKASCTLSVTVPTAADYLNLLRAERV